MSTATSSLEFLLARAAVRSDALMHIVSRRDSGLLNPICAAHPIRSQKIDEWTSVPADLSSLCADCAAIAAGIKGVPSVEAGIAVFLGSDSSGAPIAIITEVPIVSIDLAPNHARRSPGDIDDLVASITERGVVTPITLRRAGARFVVIDGARRVAATHLAGRTAIPAIVRDATENDAALDALTANIHRAALNPMDLAIAYDRALNLIEKRNKAELGRRLGVSREHISNTVRFLNLSDEDQAALAAGEITVDEARRLLAASKPIGQKHPSAPAAKLDDVAGLLEQLLATKVAVTERGNSTRFVFDVPNGDRDRFLALLGHQAAAA